MYEHNDRLLAGCWPLNYLSIFDTDIYNGRFKKKKITMSESKKKLKRETFSFIHFGCVWRTTENMQHKKKRIKN